MSEFQTIEENRGKRPVFLKVLCILTFVYTGLMILLSFMNLTSGPMGEEEMARQKVMMQESIDDFEKMGADYWVDYMESVKRFTVQANDNHMLVTVITLIFCTIGLIGALKMWKGEKLGFHMYIIYNILSISSVYFYASVGNIHVLNIIVGVIISLIFILMYSRNLKWMR